MKGSEAYSFCSHKWMEGENAFWYILITFQETQNPLFWNIYFFLLFMRAAVFLWGFDTCL